MATIETQLLENVREFTAFARKRLRDPELAADVVQESLLKALRSSDQLRDKENAKAWFYRILRRTIIDLYRRRDARDRALEDLERELDGVQNGEEERVVCSCMERLLPRMAAQHSELIRGIDLKEENSDLVAAELALAGTILTCGFTGRANSSRAVWKRIVGSAPRTAVSIATAAATQNALRRSSWRAAA